jgi:DNA mismatch endonuclease (patch repair protein)
MVDNMTRAQRSATMSKIRSKDTKAELTLRKLLHSKGYRYRVHLSSLPGKPDIVFTRRRVAVFVDGDFWHGWKFEDWAHKLAPYWRAKIERNRARDLQHENTLRDQGWDVLRIWEHQVKSDPEACVVLIEQTLQSATP